MMPSGGQCETTLFEEAMKLGSHQCQRRFGHTVDGSQIRRLPVEVGSFFPLLTRFQHHPRWSFEISEPSTVSRLHQVL